VENSSALCDMHGHKGPWHSKAERIARRPIFPSLKFIAYLLQDTGKVTPDWSGKSRPKPVCAPVSTPNATGVGPFNGHVVVRVAHERHNGQEFMRFLDLGVEPSWKAPPITTRTYSYNRGVTVLLAAPGRSIAWSYSHLSLIVWPVRTDS
jgi:hypothetical protein